MTSRTAPTFWAMYGALPRPARQAARQAFRRFSSDPHHPGLRFRELNGFAGHWYARVSLSYRVVGRRDGDAVVWYWIGFHADFDRDFR